MAKELREVCIIVGMLVIVIGSLIGGGSCSRREASASAGCNGSIAECYEEHVEFFMDSDINRRILAGTPIKYDALHPNQAAPGNSRPGRPYTGRGCNPAYTCRP